MGLCTLQCILIQFLVCAVPRVKSLTTSNFQRQGFGQRRHLYRHHGKFDSVLDASSDKASSDLNTEEQEEKFKILTCMSAGCSRKRKSLGMDDLSTFGAMYSRASDSRVTVEEGPCVGSCKKGPCVSIEHEDFFGTVALDGMTAEEFSSDAFLNIVTEEDADRIWSCVENAVRVMAEADEDKDE